MFNLLSSQKAQHVSGYVVQILDRSHVMYSENQRHITVELEFGPVVGIYSGTLSEWHSNGSNSPASQAEKALVLDRLKEGLHAMGVSQIEVC